MKERLIEPYKVLDLTDEKGFVCGWLLANLGADVIKVERPGGDVSRNIGPFYQDIPHPEKNLNWWAYNSSKRGITLDIEKPQGKEIFKKLVCRSDFVMESFPPGYIDRLKLGYQSLSEINRGLIMVSITPFGQTGPYKDYKGSDIVAVAMGGMMYMTGEPEQPPVQLGMEQSYFQGGLQGAVGAMIAHHYRQLTGEGQHVDVSLQECIQRTIYGYQAYWEFEKTDNRRHGNRAHRGAVYVHEVWPCKDGHVVWRFFGGVWGAREWRNLVTWMDSEGMAGTLLEGEWEEVDLFKLTQEEIDAREKVIGEFLLKHTKKELQAGAAKYDVRMNTVASMKDLLENGHVRERQYWMEVEHPELETKIIYPGNIHLSELTTSEIRRRAPLIGEHNLEIYRELGLSEREIATLGEEGII